MFKCGFCGEEYNDAESYVTCVNECYSKMLAEKKKNEREKLEKERRMRAAELAEAKAKYKELFEAYNKDYCSNTKEDIDSLVKLIFGF